MSDELNGGLVLFVGAAGLLGVVLGSFLNVVIYRVPNGLSIVAPASACPRCGASISPRDNVPVLSWLLLRGKCRSCKTAISLRYPLVELGTGVAFGGVAAWCLAATAGDSAAGRILMLVAFLYLAAVSIALALIDLDVHRLPNTIVLPAYGIGIVLLGGAGTLNGDIGSLARAALGMAVLWGAYLLMALVYPGGMGFGDVKLAGVLGLFLGFLGWRELAVGAFAAFVLGGMFALVLVLLRRATRKSGIPFGPWMLVGAWVGIFWGPSLWDGYLSILGVAQ